MPTAIAHITSMEREPTASPNFSRSSFKVPAPLNTSDDILDRNVWSPNRRSSSIVANGELRSSNSPRTAPPSSLLAPPTSGGSSLSSPKPGTPTRFEDPLLAMPSFRRSGGSPTVGPASAAATVGAGTGATSPLPSPSFRAGLSNSQSFTARRSAIDFRRSVPGASPSSTITSPGEALALGRGGAVVGPGRRHSLSRGTSGNVDLGNMDLLGYASSFAGSESGGPGLDDDERTVDADPDSAAATALAAGADAAAAAAAVAGSGAAGLPGRRHSAFVLRSAGGTAGSASASSSRPGGISPAARLQTRNSEDEEFMQRLQHNRNSWRERPRGSSQGAGGTISVGGGAPTSSGAAAPPCEGGLQNQTHAALEQLRGELKSLSMRSLAGSPAAAAAAAAVAAAGPVSSNAGGGSMIGPGLTRPSEGQAPQQSPSRLSMCHHVSNSCAATAASSGAGWSSAAPDLLPRRLGSAPHAGLEARTQAGAQAAVAVQPSSARASAF